MQVTFISLPSAVALKVALAVVHTVVSVMMMIATVGVPLILARMTMLDIMISLRTTTNLGCIVVLMVFIQEINSVYQRIPQIL